MAPKDPSSLERGGLPWRLDASGRYTAYLARALHWYAGHCPVEEVLERVNRWERREGRRADYILKGMNLWTEHYSVLKAEVEDPDDSGTALNRLLLGELSQARAVIVSGQALSHCVANTITDLIENLAPDVWPG